MLEANPSYWRGRPAQQGVIQVGQDHVEAPVGDRAAVEVMAPDTEARGADHALLLQPHERLDPAAARQHRFHFVRIVDQTDIQVLRPQPFQAGLDRAADRVAIIRLWARAAARLRLQADPAPVLGGQRQADPPLALPHSVASRGVDEIDSQFQRPAHRGDRCFVTGPIAAE